MTDRKLLGSMALGDCVNYLEEQIAGLSDETDEAIGAVRQLPAYPTTAGTYSLQLVVTDSAATLTWEEVETTAAASEET